MKGVVLAGGFGKRLYPLTKVTNKHLLPVYNKPMIYYPIEFLIRSGIKDMVVVSGGEHIGDFMKMLGSGAEFGANFNYAVQDGAGGLPTAIYCARHFVGADKFVVVLGDNVLLGDIRKDVEAFKKSKMGAKLFLKKVSDPEKFGVVDIKNGKIVSLEEKPKKPKSNDVLVGVYMYDQQAWEIIPQLKRSARGETEITHLSQAYLEKGLLDHAFFKGYWIDAGSSFNHLLVATNYLYAHNHKNETKKSR